MPVTVNLGDGLYMFVGKHAGIGGSLKKKFGATPTVGEALEEIIEVLSEHCSPSAREDAGADLEDLLDIAKQIGLVSSSSLGVVEDLIVNEFGKD